MKAVINNNWWIEVSDIIYNQYYTMSFLYHTKQSAIKIFKDKYKREYELEKESELDFNY